MEIIPAPSRPAASARNPSARGKRVCLCCSCRLREVSWGGAGRGGFRLADRVDAQAPALAELVADRPLPCFPAETIVLPSCLNWFSIAPARAACAGRNASWKSAAIPAPAAAARAAHDVPACRRAEDRKAQALGPRGEPLVRQRQPLQRKRPKLPSGGESGRVQDFAGATKCPLVFKWTLYTPVLRGFQAA